MFSEFLGMMLGNWYWLSFDSVDDMGPKALLVVGRVLKLVWLISLRCDFLGIRLNSYIGLTLTGPPRSVILLNVDLVFSRIFSACFFSFLVSSGIGSSSCF